MEVLLISFQNTLQSKQLSASVLSIFKQYNLRLVHFTQILLSYLTPIFKQQFVTSNLFKNRNIYFTLINRQLFTKVQLEKYRLWISCCSHSTAGQSCATLSDIVKNGVFIFAHLKLISLYLYRDIDSASVTKLILYQRELPLIASKK